MLTGYHPALCCISSLPLRSFKTAFEMHLNIRLTIKNVFPSFCRPQRGGVTLSTVHAAKGLEYPVVFVPRFHEGFLPSNAKLDEETKKDHEKAAVATEEHLKEERRLAHVAMTRAEVRCVVLFV